MVTLDRLIPQEHYTLAQISPHFWPNGKMPEREDWKRLAAEGFKDYKLRIGGLVENPVELSLADLRVLGDQETITMHHHSGVERHRAMAGCSHAESDRAGQAQAGRKHYRILVVRSGALR